MAHIRYTPASEAGPRLSALYDRYANARGELDNILRIHSLNPPSMEHHYDLYRHLMAGPSPLSRVQREMIAVTVSACNDCFY
ncbi:MAG: peroxidase [Gemmatimonadetes bacterium]|nr:peroxidase [Gemmatimonadota bacterium]MYH54122.1 peroxidase [Gemmatimonadota bacterium]MYK66985.1 peroxidase [Gemmatimonadota bacterium]